MDFLAVEARLKLENFSDGRPPPKAKRVRGVYGPRTQADADGAAETGADEGETRTVDVTYKVGARTVRADMDGSMRAQKV